MISAVEHPARVTSRHRWPAPPQALRETMISTPKRAAPVLSLGYALCLSLSPSLAWGVELPEQATQAEDARCTLRLIVLEKGRGTPVSGATVELEGAETALETDDEGMLLMPIAPGRRLIRLAAAGYIPLQVELVLKTAGSETKVVFIEPRPDQASAMVVETQRARKQVSSRTLSLAEIAQTPGTFGDPIRALESLPQVSRPKLLDGALVVRGAEPYNTSVYWDGHPIPFLYHFGIWKSVVSPVLVGSVKLIPGSLPIAYGDSLQAVVEVQDRDWTGGGLEGSADLNLMDGSIGASLPLGKSSYRLQAAARFSYLSLAVGASSAFQDPDQLIYPQYWDGSFVLEGPLAGGQLRFSGLGALDAVRLGDGQVILSPGEQERFDAYEVDPYVPYQTGFGHIHMGYRRNLAEGRELRLSLMTGFEQQISLLPLSTAIVQLPALTRLERPVMGLRADFRDPAAQGRQVGVELRVRQAAVRDLTNLYASSTLEGETPEETLLLNGYGALYGRQELGAVERSLWIPELRVAQYFFGGRTAFSLEPRLSWIHALSRAMSVRAGVGATSQMPEERDQLEATQALDLMRAATGSLGLGWEPGSGVSAEGTLFFGAMWGLPLKQLDLAYQETDFGVLGQLVQDRVPGTGLAGGLELSLRVPLGREATASASYALSASYRHSPSDGWYPGDYDQPHAVTLAASGRLFERIRMSARFRVGSGMPYTPSSGVWIPQEQSWFPISGDTNSARMPVYHQLDLRVERQILKERHRRTYYVDVQNVYLAKNGILELPSWNYQEIAGRIWLPLIPSLGMTAEF